MTDDKSRMERWSFGVVDYWCAGVRASEWTIVDGVEGEERKGDAAKRCGRLAIEDDDEDEYDGWVFGVA
jgi:hypothetical protein